MRTFAIAVMLAASAVACSKKTDSPTSKPQDSGPVTVKEPKLERDVPEMGSTYREAYDEAKKEITKDNVEDKLDDLEKDVNKGL